MELFVDPFCTCLMMRILFVVEILDQSNFVRWILFPE